jgi:hypothetical protein
VVVDDLYPCGLCVDPFEADSVLVVDADAVLAGPVAGKALESIAGGNSQFLQALDRIQLIQFPAGYRPKD